MLIKDQIRARREQLGISLVEFAEKLGVTDQAVRHWEGGRSNPSKKMAQLVERTLDFQIDWSEGARHSGSSNTINALLDQKDIDLLLVICRLPFDAKSLIGELARMHLAALERGKRAINEREATQPIPPFLEKKQDTKGADKKERTPAVKARARKASSR